MGASIGRRKILVKTIWSKVNYEKNRSECLRCLQGGKGGAARLRPWSPRQPLSKPHKVQGRSRGQMLEMGLGEPHIARLPEATPSDALGVGTLDPCPRCILLAELFRRLPFTGLLQRLVR